MPIAIIYGELLQGNNNAVRLLTVFGGKMAEENAQFLVPQDTYLKSGIHIGTKFRTRYMEQFIYKIRPDGLSVLNLQKIDERIGIAARFLSQYKPDEILIVSRRENGWKALRAFQKATGCRIYAGRYPPGTLTNPALKTFTEVRIILVTDSWPDRNAIQDANRVGVPVIALCDSNNQANEIDLVVPCNNKGKKSLGLFFYLLAREFLRNTGKIAKDAEIEVPIDEFMEE